jgi:hypothetical protein
MNDWRLKGLGIAAMLGLICLFGLVTNRQFLAGCAFTPILLVVYALIEDML